MGQNLLDSDSFNTGSPADGTLLHTYNANWNLLASGVGNVDGETFASGAACSVSSTRSAVYRTGQTWTANQWCQLTIDATTLANIAGSLFLRAQNDGTFTVYEIFWYVNNTPSNSYAINRWDNGVPTGLATSTVVAAVGDVVNAQMVGTAITVQVNGSTIASLSITDATYATGNPGFGLKHTAQGIRLVGSWQAGSVGASLTPAQLVPALTQGMAQPWYSTYV